VISVMDGRAIDQHLALIHANGSVEYPLADASNSTVATADHAGNILQTFAYEPFGLTVPNGSAFPFQFAGRVPIAGTIYSYRARYYDSSLGRFISEDPIGFADFDANLYALRDPVNFTDPLGFAAGPCQIVAKVVQIKGRSNGLEYRRSGSSRWYTAYEGQHLYVGDELRSDSDTVAAAEFALGGRVGVNRNSDIQIADESSVKEAGKPQTKRILIHPGGMWAKVAKHSDPLEIQTNGGVMGIKDTMMQTYEPF